LTRRGWTQADLASILGRHLPAVSEVINGRRSITPHMAVALAGAFGNEPEYWLNLDGRFRLSRLDRTRDPEVSRRAWIFGLAPVRDMEARGWIHPTRSREALEAELCRFFAVGSLDQDPPFSGGAARMGPSDRLSAAERAWCVRGARLAVTSKVAKFNDARFAREMPGLRALAERPQKAKQVPKAVAELGVRLVLVEPLPQGPVDGAAFWLDDESPVVLLSVRSDRIEDFWHALAHEMCHVRRRDGFSLDRDLAAEGPRAAADSAEARAEREAAEFLVPSPVMKSLITRTRPRFSKARIVEFARRAGVHPGIVAMQLRLRGEMSGRAHRDLTAKIREEAVSAALTDGWGFSVPAL
jgi:HTH-type transcriptional regulator/antitoxin HigA